ARQERGPRLALGAAPHERPGARSRARWLCFPRRAAPSGREHCGRAPYVRGAERPARDALLGPRVPPAARDRSCLCARRARHARLLLARRRMRLRRHLRRPFAEGAPRLGADGTRAAREVGLRGGASSQLPIIARVNPLDLRTWLAEVEKLGELRHVRGADWNLELGAISELNVKKDLPPALLFDEIKGYP